MNAWLEPRFTADVDITVQIVVKLIADRPKDRIDLQGLVELPGLDWSYVEGWVDAWEVRDRLEALRRSRGAPR